MRAFSRPDRTGRSTQRSEAALAGVTARVATAPGACSRGRHDHPRVVKRLSAIRVPAIRVPQKRGQTHRNPLAAVLNPRQAVPRGVPTDVPTAESPANRDVGTLLAFCGSAKRNHALTTASLHRIASRARRGVRSARFPESPANGGKCAQGDSNSHGPNGPQGPQPDPRRWTLRAWWTGRWLSRCCHGLCQAARTSLVLRLRTGPIRTPWRGRSSSPLE